MTFFSIIVPTYNRAHMIRRTLDSVLNQSFKDFELIVVDDGSTDNTEEIVASYNSPQILYFKKENEERGIARNFGLEKAQGRYVNFFDSDDVMYPHHLEKAFENLEALSSPKVLCFPFDYLDSEGKLTGTKTGFDGDITTKVLESNFIHLNGAFIARDILDSDLKFCEDRKFTVSEDWYFFVRISMKHSILGIQESTSGYYIHEGSTMSSISSEEYQVAYGYFESLFSEQAYRNPKAVRKVKSEFYSMTALALALENKPMQAIRFLVNSFFQEPETIFRKRTLGVIKNLFYAERRV